MIGCCRDPERADSLKELAATSGGRVQVVKLDVADEAIASLKRSLGDQPIDILINNAGINGTPKAQSANCIDPEGCMTSMRVNALSLMLMAQALRNNLKRSPEKKLVVIMSDFGSTGVDKGSGTNASERYAYPASKAALNNGMRALSRDWAGDGPLVGILNPDLCEQMWVARGRLPHPRASLPKEAGVASLVASPSSRPPPAAPFRITVAKPSLGKSTSVEKNQSGPPLSFAAGAA